MNALVIYSSKAGFTKKYAEWIAVELAADLLDISQVKGPEIFESYDTVIFGGGMHIGKVNDVKFIKKNLDKLAGKKVIVFGVGIAKATHGRYEEYEDKNFNGKQRGVLKFFYFQGGLNIEKLPKRDKLMMNMMTKMMGKKDPETLNEEERNLLDACKTPVDYTDVKAIEPLIAYAKA